MHAVHTMHTVPHAGCVEVRSGRVAAVPLSSDHTPMDQAEADRVLASGVRRRRSLHQRSTNHALKAYPPSRRPVPCSRRAPAALWFASGGLLVPTNCVTLTPSTCQRHTNPSLPRPHGRQPLLPDL
jgi:hypothetical protein